MEIQRWGHANEVEDDDDFQKHEKLRYANEIYGEEGFLELVREGSYDADGSMVREPYETQNNVSAPVSSLPDSMLVDAWGFPVMGTSDAGTRLHALSIASDASNHDCAFGRNDAVVPSVQPRTLSPLLTSAKGEEEERGAKEEKGGEEHVQMVKGEERDDGMDEGQEEEQSPVLPLLYTLDSNLKHGRSPLLPPFEHTSYKMRRLASPSTSPHCDSPSPDIHHHTSSYTPSPVHVQRYDHSPPVSPLTAAPYAHPHSPFISPPSPSPPPSPQSRPSFAEAKRRAIAELMTQRVPELQCALRIRSLPVLGLRRDLLERLGSHIAMERSHVRPPHEDEPEVSYLSRFRVPELKEVCRRRSLPVGGLKDDLSRRIMYSMREEQRRTSRTARVWRPDVGWVHP